MASLGILVKYDFNGCGGCWLRSEKGWSNEFTAATIAKATKKRRLSISASSAWAESQNSPRSNFYQEVLKAARDKFTREISFQSEDNDISLQRLYYMRLLKMKHIWLSSERLICNHSIRKREKFCYYLTSKSGTVWKLCLFVEITLISG